MPSYQGTSLSQAILSKWSYTYLRWLKQGWEWLEKGRKPRNRCTTRMSSCRAALPSRTQSSRECTEPSMELKPTGCEEHCRRRVSGRASSLDRKGTRPSGGVRARLARCGLHTGRDDSRNAEGRPMPAALSSSPESLDNPNHGAWLLLQVEASSFVCLQWRVCLSLPRRTLTSAPT